MQDSLIDIKKHQGKSEDKYSQHSATVRHHERDGENVVKTTYERGMCKPDRLVP